MSDAVAPAELSPYTLAFGAMNNMKFLLPLQNLVEYPSDAYDDAGWYGVYIDKRRGSVESTYRLRHMVDWEKPPTDAEVEAFRDMVAMFLGKDISISRQPFTQEN